MTYTLTTLINNNNNNNNNKTPFAEYAPLTDLSPSLGGVGEGDDINTPTPTLAHVGDAERYYELWKDKPVEDTNNNNNNNNNR